MNLGRTARFRLVLLLLAVVPVALAAYKARSRGFHPADVLPLTRHKISWDLSLDGHNDAVRVRTFLPASDIHQEVSEEADVAPGFDFGTQTIEENRIGTWNGADVPDGAHIQHSLSVVTHPVKFDLDPSLLVPRSHPSSVAKYLRPEPDIQVDAPEIVAKLEAIGAHKGSLTERLDRIMRATSALTARPFKGTTDALTALRLNEASCNGKSRLFVALARAAGIPARLVGGLILATESKRTSHQWLQVWVAGHWVPYCPTNGYAASLPQHYLTLYYGDETLFRHTSDVNFDYQFTTTEDLVPSPRAKLWVPSINVWALFERLGLSYSLLRTVLMLPVGALVVVLCRNVAGIPTFGTFLPALIAAAAGETGALWGAAGVLLIVGVVALSRWLFQRLELLHSPMLAILLAVVTSTMLGISLLAEMLHLGRLVYISLFPIAVLAITAERFYLALTERGPIDAGRELGGTLLVMLACHVVMSSLALQAILIGFPEALLLVVATNVYLGRWVGLRVSEYFRFRRLLVPGESP